MANKIMNLPKKIEPKKILTDNNIRRDLRNITIDIPENNSIVTNNPLDYTTLIYGPKKIGKTDFVSQWGAKENSTLFLMFEKLARHLSIRQILISDHIDEKNNENITAWLFAEAILENIINDSKNIRTICADGLGAMYDKALLQACKEGNFIHPGGQDDYGKSWDKVKRVFYRFLDRLINSNFGVVFTTHDILLQHETNEGTKSQIVPNISRQAEEFIRLKVDNIFYYHYRGKERWLQLRGDDLIYAGCAPKENFLTVNGEPIWMIPMGKSSEQAYKNFINAFYNKQDKTFKEVTKEDIKEIEKMKGDTIIRKTKEKKKYF